MEYAKPTLARADLMVEHCMCCTGNTIKDLLTGCNSPQPTPVLPMAE